MTISVFQSPKDKRWYLSYGGSLVGDARKGYATREAAVAARAKINRDGKL